MRRTRGTKCVVDQPTFLVTQDFLVRQTRGDFTQQSLVAFDAIRARRHCCICRRNRLGRQPYTVPQPTHRFSLAVIPLFVFVGRWMTLKRKFPGWRDVIDGWSLKRPPPFCVLIGSAGLHNRPVQSACDFKTGEMAWANSKIREDTT